LPKFRADLSHGAKGVMKSRLDFDRPIVVAHCFTEVARQPQTVRKIPVKGSGAARQSERAAIELVGAGKIPLRCSYQTGVLPQICTIGRGQQRLLQVSARLVEVVGMDAGDSHEVKRVQVLRLQGQHLPVAMQCFCHTSRIEIGVRTCD
jgi:hypothetical protein